MSTSVLSLEAGTQCVDCLEERSSDGQKVRFLNLATSNFASRVTGASRAIQMKSLVNAACEIGILRKAGLKLIDDDPGYVTWLRDNPPPSLEALIDRAGRRHASSIGEVYIEDPFERMRKAPHQGGYAHITPEEWAAYEREMADWQIRRRSRTVRR